MTDHGNSFSQPDKKDSNRNKPAAPRVERLSRTAEVKTADSKTADRNTTELKNAVPKPAVTSKPIHAEIAPAPVAGSAVFAAVLGAGLSVGFYGLLIVAMKFGPTQAYTGQLERYFLGHPVAVAATILFSFALAMLVAKTLGVMAQNAHLDRIRDIDLLPAAGKATGPAEAWLDDNDAGHVSRNWLSQLAGLPEATRQSHFVTRLQEVLTRQAQRGSAKHLADDLRELAGRDGDAAHDSLGLVRIIVWAIPMLGFLGTVIGITQTLGGLDFSSGTGAVDNLKSGLYVAFDTTAMGLVLSVVAIFLQFPVERGEQRLLAAIDARVGHMVSSTLPSDDASDNQTVLIAELCRGVQAAVAESLSNQASLWQSTINEAQKQWQNVHEKNNTTLADAFEVTLAPALLNHATTIREASDAGSRRWNDQCERWQASVAAAQTLLERTSLDSSKRIDQQTASLHETLDDVCETIASQQQTLAGHYASLNQTHDAIAKLTAATESLHARMSDPDETMADAMVILARAVDTLSKRMVVSSPNDAGVTARRAA